MSPSASTLGSNSRSKVAKIVIVQACVVLALSLAMMLWHKGYGVSFLLGGFTCILPSAYFSYRFFKVSGARHSQQIVKNFYLGELIKIVMTVLMFVFAFKSGIAQPAPLFIGYGLALILQWSAPLYVKNL